MKTAKQNELDVLFAKVKAEMKSAARYDRLQNEGGEGYSSEDDVFAKYSQQFEALQKEIAEESEISFKAEWTKEVTAERRAIWNKEVKAKSSWTPAGVRGLEKRLGFEMGAMKKAVSMHA